MTARETGKGKGEREHAGRAFPVSRFPFPRYGRLLAIDWGTKRIGLAISDPAQTVATPLGTLTRRAGRRFPMAQLRPYLETYHPVGVLLGLPLDASGAESAAAQAARETGALIATKTGLPVAYWDERMTTARVHRAQRETGGAGAGARRTADPLAATLLLQACLDHRRS